jgi:NarL family two-component system sensor histidine kinase LiaS
LLTLLVGAGWASFGYANYAQVRAQAAHRESQSLLAELQTAHRQLQDYAEQVQTLTLAEERNRLARELHDSAKQLAFAASAQLATARSLLNQEPDKAQAHLIEAEQLMHQVSRELTDLIHELRPVALEGRGLVEALRDHVGSWSQRNGVEANLRVQGERALPVEVEQALFRTAQEALSNVARHSQAQNTEITISYNSDTVAMTISDDGGGFDPHTSTDGIGLCSIRERAERLDGMLRIESAPGRGTRVVATYPTRTPAARSENDVGERQIQSR